MNNNDIVFYKLSLYNPVLPFDALLFRSGCYSKMGGLLFGGGGGGYEITVPCYGRVTKIRESRLEEGTETNFPIHHFTTTLKYTIQLEVICTL